jgi:hypothetical protein
MLHYRLAWVLWIAGTVVIVLSWGRVVSPSIGWAGFALALVGTAVSKMPGQSPAAAHPDQWPVAPSGVQVGPDTPLGPGSRVLAYSEGHWWRARVVAVEDGGMVRIHFAGWDPTRQFCVPRGYLQLDLTTAPPGNAAGGEADRNR